MRVIMKNIPPEIIRSIEDAAAYLIATGNINPTNAQIRTHLGGGRLSFISQVMRNFRSRRHDLDCEQATTLPPELAQLLSTQMGLLWKAAAKQADVLALRQQAYTDIAQAEEDLAQADVEIENALAQIEQLKKELADTQSAYERAKYDFNCVNIEKDKALSHIELLENELAGLSQIAKEKEELQLQFQELLNETSISPNQVEYQISHNKHHPQEEDVGNEPSTSDSLNLPLATWPPTF